LLLGRHGCESPSFLAFTCIHHSALRLFTTNPPELRRDPLVPSAVADPRCEGDAARPAASPALRQDRCRAGPRNRAPAGTCTPGALCSNTRSPHPSDYQTPCLSGVAGPSAQMFVFLWLRFSPPPNTAPC